MVGRVPSAGLLVAADGIQEAERQRRAEAAAANVPAAVVQMFPPPVQRLGQCLVRARQFLPWRHHRRDQSWAGSSRLPAPKPLCLDQGLLAPASAAAVATAAAVVAAAAAAVAAAVAAAAAVATEPVSKINVAAVAAADAAKAEGVDAGVAANAVAAAAKNAATVDYLVTVAEHIKEYKTEALAKADAALEKADAALGKANATAAAALENADATAAAATATAPETLKEDL